VTKHLIAFVCIQAAAGTLMAETAALRSIARFGDICWAVGDGGTVLTSKDEGATWQAVPTQTTANLQSAAADGKSVFVFGGASVTGHPDGVGIGVILRSDDSGKSFNRVRAPAAGWLYGGRFAGSAGVVFGQACPTARSGIWRTVTGGRLWRPLETESSGFLRGAAFRSIHYGYLVGQNHRIVSLRRLGEPAHRPVQVPSALGLNAAAFAEEETCWAVGENGTVLRSLPTGRPWMPVQVVLPSGTKRLADFETIAFAAAGRAWIGGGLVGVLAHTANDGSSWRLLPAPGPGPIHSMVHLGGRTLLACGDAGRIWRSTDDGRSWNLLHGTEKTDVLFIQGAADESLFPAIVAHARAGCNVAVLFATVPVAKRGIPGDQALRAGAIAAGAAGVMTLSDFRSLASDGDETLSEQEILAAWSKDLDSPAEREVLRQMAAAIRLYRPDVVVVGPYSEGFRGRRAENRLIARLARRAAKLAARQQGAEELTGVGLRPWAAKRVFVGFDSNANWIAPWDKKSFRLEASEAATLIDTAKFPAGGKTSLEMLALDAAWKIPRFGLLDRPSRFSAYACLTERNRFPLFTSGLNEARLRTETVEDARRDLSLSTALRIAATTGTRSIATALGMLVPAAEKAGSDPLAADRLLLAWAKMLAQGRFVHAEQAMDAFLAHGRTHPLFERMNVAALAAAVSAEWNAQLTIADPRRPANPPKLARAVRVFDDWPIWSTTGAGRMLLAKGLIASGQAPRAKEILQELTGKSYSEDWRRAARLELGILDPYLRRRPQRTFVTARHVPLRGRIDGRLDELFWETSARIDLQGGDESLRGSFQLIRTATHLVAAVRLPAAWGRTWTLDVAVDADRDAWTQVVVHCETLGKKWARLIPRIGPPAALNSRRFIIQARKDEEDYTFELALPLIDLGADVDRGGLWNFQVRATANDFGQITRLYFHPQPDARLLPERYGLLKVGPKSY